MSVCYCFCFLLSRDARAARESTLMGDGCQAPSGGAQVLRVTSPVQWEVLAAHLPHRACPLLSRHAATSAVQRLWPGHVAPREPPASIRGHATRIFSSSSCSTASLSRSECEPASVAQSERAAHLSFLLLSCHCWHVPWFTSEDTASLGAQTPWTSQPCSPSSHGSGVPHVEDSGAPMSLAAFMK